MNIKVGVIGPQKKKRRTNNRGEEAPIGKGRTGKIYQIGIYA